MRLSMLTLLLLSALCGAALMALAFGARSVPLSQVWAALVTPDPGDPAHLTVTAIRLPRLWAALIAGAGLGMAGVLMQAVTRNPLAEPGLLGVSAGAGFAVVAGSFLWRLGDPALLALLAFPGAALASIAVFMLGGGGQVTQGGTSPARLALAGVAINALLVSAISGMVLTRNETLELYRFWVVGALSGAGERPLALMGGIVAAAGAGALLTAGRFDLLAMGDDAARGLGAHPGAVRAIALLLVTALCGAAVVVAGPVAFVGLAVAHLARFLAGPGVRGCVWLALFLGPVLLMLADTAGRLVIAPEELRLGTMAGLLGGPLFVLIVRRLRPGAWA
ncbi:FecCD family ABC transporter permease [Halodurantibacterium flavum]|uniref:FecCD family ABC transporter permease n=1 Tax=Halodurantibacterium flavum TaxID=1382802 RepID=A0ABW4S4M9_9RHOB